MSASPALTQRRYVPEDLLEFDDEGVGYELNDEGELEKRAMSLESSEVGAEILALIRNFVREHRLGRVLNSEIGMRLWPGQPRRLRRPDAAFVREERAPVRGTRQGFLETPPDLIVEVVSPGDNAELLEEKLREYREGGVRLTWVIHPLARTARVVRLDGTAQQLGEEDSLDGEDVLPGFSVRVGDLFFQ